MKTSITDKRSAWLRLCLVLTMFTLGATWSAWGEDNTPRFFIPDLNEDQLNGSAIVPYVTPENPYFQIHIWYRNTNHYNTEWTGSPKLTIDDTEISLDGFGNHEKEEPKDTKAWHSTIKKGDFVLYVSGGFKFDDVKNTLYSIGILDGSNFQKDDDHNINDDWYLTVDVLCKNVEVGHKFKISLIGTMKECGHISDPVWENVKAKDNYGNEEGESQKVVSPFPVLNSSAEWITGKDLKLTTPSMTERQDGESSYVVTLDGVDSVSITSGAAEVTRHYANEQVLTSASDHTVNYTFHRQTYKFGDNDVDVTFADKETVKVAALPHPGNMKVEYNTWKQETTLKWEFPGSDQSDKLNAWFYVMRDGVLLDSVGANVSAYTDAKADYDTPYLYKVVYQPRSFVTPWRTNTSLSDSINTDMVRTFQFVDSLDIQTVSSGYQLNWKVSEPMPDSLSFRIYRAEVFGSEIPQITDADSYIATVKGNGKTAYSWTDQNYNTSSAYYYEVHAHVMQKEYALGGEPSVAATGTCVKNISATRGVYSDKVVIKWNTLLMGEDTANDYIYRRAYTDAGYGSATEGWTLLDSICGISRDAKGNEIGSEYSDETVVMGEYYQYAVICCPNGTAVGRTVVNTDGYARSTGDISGRLTYVGGTGVPGARVALLTDSKQDGTSAQFYALALQGKGGICWDAQSSHSMQSYFGDGKPFSVQLYAMPDSAQTAQAPCLLDMGKSMRLTLGQYTADGKGYPVMVSVGSTPVYTSQYILPTHVFTHVALTISSEHSGVLYFVDANDSICSESFAFDQLPSLTERVCVGMASADTPTDAMRGYVDDIRFFNRQLTQADVLQNYNHTLGGTEAGLIAYWNLDEDVRTLPYAYDTSSDANDVKNNNHAQIIASQRTTIRPSDYQLSLFAVSDTTGTYHLQGIPFNGGGTAYAVTPSLGTHEFNPTDRIVYLSKSATSISNVDFTDKSSFTVTGTVYYENTLYPVQGCTFWVGDVQCKDADGFAITSDENGKYAIDVPNGPQVITVKKDDHTFLNDGRYPVVDTFDFNRDVTGLTFTDQTKSIVVGRISGGPVQQSKPLGMGASIANIGSATITLLTGSKESNSVSMNVSLDKNTGVLNDSAEPLDYQPANPDYVHSHAWVGGTNNGQGMTKYITIQTDSVTGEFAVLLPPVEYFVKSIVVGKNPDVSFDSPVGLNATNVSKLYTDSVIVEGADGQLQPLHFSYHTAYNQAYRAVPEISVAQTRTEMDGAFGEYLIPRTLPTGETDSVAAYHLSADTIAYDYGSPIFLQGESYTLSIDGYETYRNYDDSTNVIVDQVPMVGSEVTVDNPISFYDSKATVDSNAGTVERSSSSPVFTLDSLGHADYEFVAGFPNVTDEHLDAIDISFDVNGTPSPWYWKPAQRLPLVATVFGVVQTGRNFVVGGPDQIDNILRDPYGSGSYTQWEEGSSVTRNWTTKTNSSVGFNFVKTKETTLFKIEEAVGAPGVYDILSASGSLTGTNTLDITAGHTWNHSHSYTTTNKKAIKTGSDSSHDGAMGDVFVGHGTSYNYGSGTSVELVTDDGVNYHVGTSEVMCQGESIGLDFTYSQYEITKILIPNLRSNRNTFLQTVSESDYQKMTSEGANDTDHVIYITTLSPDDPDFGNSYDADGNYINEQLNEYCNQTAHYAWITPRASEGAWSDTIAWYNTQIGVWESYLSLNEQEKYTAIMAGDSWLYQNYSFETGASETLTLSTSETNSDTNDFTLNFSDKFALGVSMKGRGTFNGTYTGTGGHNYGFTYKSDRNTTSTYTYNFAEGINDNIHELAIYRAVGGHSMVFRQMGGQTSRPYEGAEYTKYYEPGFLLSDSTVQVEVPHIGCLSPKVYGVPSQGKALFELQLSNATQATLTKGIDYVLYSDHAPGVSISAQGHPLSYDFSLDPGATYNCTLEVTQDNPNVTDYDSIHVIFGSKGQITIYDDIWLSAYYQKVGMNVDLKCDQNLVNSRNNALHLSVTGYDASHEALQSVEIQYCLEGGAWTTLHSYTKGTITPGDLTASPLPVDGIDTLLVMDNDILFPDGQYKFRAQTTCLYDVYEYGHSDESVITKDVRLPQPAGLPQPADGILGVGDDISVKLSEPLVWTSLDPDYNFVVQGVLNNDSVDHAVALMLNGADEPDATTQTAFTLSNTSFTFNTWLSLSGQAGTLLCHGSGSEIFLLSVDAEGHLSVRMGSTTVTSTNTLPLDGQWVYLSVAYDVTTGGLAATYATANDEQQLLAMSQIGTDARSQGFLALGKGLTGAMHGLSLYNKALSWTEAKAQMYAHLGRNTEGLIGYWSLDEGYGLSSTDAARSRTMVLQPNRWYLADANYALSLDGQHSAGIPLATLSAGHNDSYLFELWMRADQQQDADTVRLFSLDGGQVLDANIVGGELCIVADSLNYTTRTTVADGSWHHVAFNALKGGDGQSSVLIDGVSRASILADDTPALQGAYLWLGQHMKGLVDEVRLWHGSHTQSAINERMHTRLDPSSVDGLVAYYPMEMDSVDVYQQHAFGFSTQNKVSDQMGNTALVADADSVVFASSDANPGLKAAPVKENLRHSITTSESDNTVYLSLSAPASQLEDCTVSVTMRNYYDCHENIGNPVTWSFLVRQNPLSWYHDELSLSIPFGEAYSFTDSLYNAGGTQQQWSFSSLPSWISAEPVSGTIDALGYQPVTFTISDATAIGRYTTTLYASGNEGILTPLDINVTVAGETPDWQVNKLGMNMTVVGTLVVNDVLSTDPDDMVAAFIDGLCVGLAHPTYYADRDAYYISMMVYGDHNGDAVTFRVYDASTGTIYPVVEASPEVTFSEDAICRAVTWTTLDAALQNLAFTNNWSWRSAYVCTDQTADQVFAPKADIILQLVSQTDTLKCDDAGVWTGTAPSLAPAQMFKVQSTQSDAVELMGPVARPADYPVTITGGSTWFGVPSSSSYTVAEVFTDPVINDVIKSQTDHAFWSGTQWVGTLTSLQPGEGYTYVANDSTRAQSVVTFPDHHAAPARTDIRQAHAHIDMDRFGHCFLYPSSMHIMAVVRSGEGYDSEARLEAVDAQGETRGVQDGAQGDSIYLMALYGDVEGEPLYLSAVTRDGSRHYYEAPLLFRSDVLQGRIHRPLVIDMSDVVSLASLDQSSVVSLTVTGVMGQPVYQASGAGCVAGFSRDDLPAGIYVVRAISYDGRVTTRVIER